MENKIALITGANRGIGLAIAKGLCARGYEVLVGSRNLQAGKEAIGSIEGIATAVELDLSDQALLENQLGAIQDIHPKIDVLVNNAGILEHGNLLEIVPEKLYKSMRINFEAPYELCRFLVPGMIERGYGRVVNVSSGWGSFSDGLTGPPTYSVSKAALNALTLSMARSVPPGQVKINAMCPGWVRTRMGGQSASRSPEKGAETAIWLAGLSKDGPSGAFFRDKRQIDW